MRKDIVKTKSITNPHRWILRMQNDFAQWVIDEEKAPTFKGQWRDKVFKENNKSIPLDLEIGTGNGYFFTHHATQNPDRLFLGLELKYKPLIQAMQRALSAGAQKARIARYDAYYIEDLFTQNEINNVFIHHPDPWTKRKKIKNRLMHKEFLEALSQIQKPESFLEFKTDSDLYFEWAMEQIQGTAYQLVKETKDLHNSEWANQNFVTHFEKLFVQKGKTINYALFLNAREN